MSSIAEVLDAVYGADLEKVAYDFAAAAKTLRRFKDVGRIRESAYAAIPKKGIDYPLRRPSRGDYVGNINHGNNEVAKPVPPAARKHLEAIIQQHELDELAGREFGGRGYGGFKGHAGPDIILREHNRVVTSPTEVRQSVVDVLKSRRMGGGEARDIRAAVPAFKYGESPRLSRHARRRIVQLMADKEFAKEPILDLSREARLTTLRDPDVRNRVRDYMGDWKRERQAGKNYPGPAFLGFGIGTDAFWRKNAENRIRTAVHKSQLKARGEPTTDVFDVAGRQVQRTAAFQAEKLQRWSKLKKFEGG